MRAGRMLAAVVVAALVQSDASAQVGLFPKGRTAPRTLVPGMPGHGSGLMGLNAGGLLPSFLTRPVTGDVVELPKVPIVDSGKYLKPFQYTRVQTKPSWWMWWHWLD